MQKLVKALAIIGTLAGTVASSMAHETFIGQTADHQLAFILDDHLEVPIPLDESMMPGIPGFAADEPGLVSLDVSSEGFEPLNPLSEIELLFLGGDAEIQMWGEGADQPLAPGETLYLGLAPFHVHAIWNIHAGEAGGVYELNFQFRDRSGIASTSEPIALSFTAVPEPASLNLLAAGLLITCKRRT